MNIVTGVTTLDGIFVSNSVIIVTDWVLAKNLLENTVVYGIFAKKICTV